MPEEHENQTIVDSDEEPMETEIEPDDGPSGEGDSGVDLNQIRDLVLAAHPDVVPEMVRGESFDELMASVEPARGAYQRIVGQMTEKTETQPVAPKVASQPGRRGATIVEIESLSPLGKISEGLRRV
jgi:hypothetical protein